MATNSTPKGDATPAGGKPAWRPILGYVAAVVAAVCLLYVLYTKINNKPFEKKEWAILVLAGIAFVGCVVAWWQEIIGGGNTRGAMLNANALVTIAAALVIVILVNYWIIPRRLSWVKKDLTAGKYYSLSEQTTKIVKSITAKDPVEMYALLPMDQFARMNQDAARSLELNQRRLKEYERLNANLSVQTMDPNVNPKASQIIKDSNISAIPGVVVRYKNDPKTFETINSLEEAEITRGINKLIDGKGKKRRAMVLTGHGELPLAGPAGGDPSQGNAAELKKLLDDDRYEIADAKLLPTPVPSDITVVLTLGPKAAFSPAETASLKDWLGKGGRLLAALDPDSKSNLAEILKGYGIEYVPSVVTDPPFMVVANSPQIFLAEDYGTHEATGSVKRTRMPALCYRTGYFKRGTVPPDMDFTELVKTSTDSTIPSADGKAPGPKGPFAVVATVSTKDPKADDKSKSGDDKAAQPDDTKVRTRIAVIGSSEFVSLGSQGGQAANTELTGNLVNWLADNSKALGIRPKNPWDDEKERKINMTDALRKKVLLFTFWLPLLLCLGAGVSVTVLRARR